MNDAKRILAVGVDRKLLADMKRVLSRSVLSLDGVPRGGSALSLCGRVPFDLVIVGEPLPDMDLAEFLTTLRKAESKCGRSPVLVVTDESRLLEARRHLEPGRDMALSTRQRRRLLDEIGRRLVGAPPRVAARMFVRLDARLHDQRSQVVCQTENLSEQGALVRMERPQPVGTRTVFEMHLPGERAPLEGMAEVVRHAVPEMEDVHGMGLRFVALKGDGRERLAAFLSRQPEMVAH
jgi:uncharacterized protein (TIGR02266 family)